MRISRLFRATAFRLALVQTLLFVVTFAAAGVLAVAVVRRAEHQAVDAEIAQEVSDLSDVYGRAGLGPLQDTIGARQRDPSIWEFRVEGADHRRLAGDLPTLAYPPGWSTIRLIEGDQPDNQSEVVRLRSTPLAGGLVLTVGEDLGQRERADNALLGLVASIAVAAAGLSLAAGALAGRRVLRRVDAMLLAMERYGAGELDARVGAGARASSDLDQLASALNRMMDRTTRLMDGMRQISADIAHDLRRPLARHNQEIARVLSGVPSVAGYRAALEAAAGEVDEVLRTFQALLHIAELEAGAPGLDLQPVDLAEVAARVVQAYQPSAEQGGRSLRLEAATAADQGMIVRGDPRLLGQMIANLVENALIHTPPGTRVAVAVDPARARLSVTDDGPGVPAEMRSRIFERFVRLDASRSTAGNGLGLALSSAVVSLSGGRVFAEDASPGLRVVVSFESQTGPGVDHAARLGPRP